MITMTMQTEISPADIKVLDDGIVQYNIEKCGLTWQPLYLLLRDEQGQLVGGLTGQTEWGWLYVKLLWLSEALRQHGWGSRLLQAAEDEARKRGCKYVHLDSFGFQAPGFYQKHGYEVFGILEHYPPGYNRYYLKKTL